MGVVINIDLSSKFRRPTIRYSTEVDDLNILLDTGATKPVWNGNSDTLTANFPDAEITEYKTTVSGFGGVSKNIREVWKIPYFELVDKTDKDKKYVIRNLLVAVVDDINIGFNLILSATLFKKVNYSFINSGDNAPYLSIECDSRDYYCIADDSKEHNQVTYISRVTTFVQGEESI